MKGHAVCQSSLLTCLLPAGEPSTTIPVDFPRCWSCSTLYSASSSKIKPDMQCLGDSTDEGLKITSCLSDAVMDPKTTHSTEINEAAFQRAFNTPLSFFEWLEQPEQDYKRKRYGVGMPGALSPFWPPMLLTGQYSRCTHNASAVLIVSCQRLTGRLCRVDLLLSMWGVESDTGAIPWISPSKTHICNLSFRRRVPT